MAGTFTHFKFMNELDNKLNFKGDKALFLVAGQGHDLLFFIKLKDFSKFRMRSDIAKKIAKEKFAILVKCWQEEIIRTANAELECLLYGYVAHHVLDAYIHPWINNTCDCYFDKEDEKTWLNNGKHEKLESIIDVLIANPYKQRIPYIKLQEKTINSLNSIFDEVYNIANVGDLYSDGLKAINGFIKVYRNDKLGIKRLGYKFIDLMSKENGQKFEFLSLNYSKKDKVLVKKIYMNEFNKLYDEALKMSEKLILEIENNLEHKKIADIAFDKPAI